MLEAIQKRVQFFVGSWSALGGLLGRSWRPLGALLDDFGGLLDAQRLPKAGPRGPQMEPRRGLEREIVEFAETSKFVGRLS